jgi:hypothetical protein
MKVKMSARIWQGWNSLVRPLITGTRECAAKLSILVLLEGADHHQVDHAADDLGAVVDGLGAASWLSPVVRCTTLPPIWYMPASKLTRVRVEAFSKIIASVRSASGWYFS